MRASPIQDAKNFLYEIQKTKNELGQTGLLTSDELAARKNILDLNILVCVDVSGSISRAQFCAFMQQIDAIKGLSRVKVIEVDTDIVAMYDYFKVPQSRVMRLGGGGGTAFNKCFTRAKKMKPDAILFMTDGFVADSVSNPGIPTGWVLTHNGRQPYGFGKTVVKMER